MSVFTFSEAIGYRTRISDEELTFLIRDHNITEDEAIKILAAMKFDKGLTDDMQNEFWSPEVNNS